MADLGRAALVVSLGLSVYALVAGAIAAVAEPAPPRRLGAQRALRRFGSTLVAAVVLASRARPPRLLVRLRRRAHEPHAADARTR